LNEYRQYSGIIHVHSVFSDGSRPIPEIAQIANELNVRFLLITDHNTLRGKEEGFEGWYGNVLVGVGVEINDAKDQNHYLAFDIDETFDPSLPAEQYVKRVRELGGFGIIAHPDECRNHLPDYPPYPWTLWDSEYFDGIEIWNQMSEWMEGLTHFNKYWRVWHPRRSIVTPKKETLARWDQLNMKRKVAGVGGVDAHGYLHRFWGFFSIRIFRYKVSFRTIRTHILTREELTPDTDHRVALKIVYDAIRNARCFVSHVYFGDAGDFRFFAANDKEFAVMGERLSCLPETRFYVRIPDEAEASLIYNGQKIEQKTGREVSFRNRGAGIYRIEVTKDGRPWIFSNHIRLLPEEQ